jgi:hypothetical protein
MVIILSVLEQVTLADKGGGGVTGQKARAVEEKMSEACMRVRKEQACLTISV